MWIVRLAQLARLPTTVLATLAYWVNGVAAQANVAGQPAETQVDFLKWALTQGGLVVVVLVIFWSYRRDLVSLFRHEQERNNVLMNLVREAACALTKAAEASSALTKTADAITERALRGH